jgi:hypothetical protein
MICHFGYIRKSLKETLVKKIHSTKLFLMEEIFNGGSAWDSFISL